MLYVVGGANGPIPPVKANKLKCLLHYFTRVTSQMPEGTITFQRLVLTTPPKWEKSDAMITSLHVDSHGTIEDCGHGMLQVSARILIFMTITLLLLVTNPHTERDIHSHTHIGGLC